MVLLLTLDLGPGHRLALPIDPGIQISVIVFVEIAQPRDATDRHLTGLERRRHVGRLDTHAPTGIEAVALLDREADVPKWVLPNACAEHVVAGKAKGAEGAQIVS
jgi:hypothetical protein